MATIKVLDGGLGTSLEDKYGVKFNHSQPLWSSHFLISSHDTLLACQKDFVEAGADVLLTATYQLSVEGFARTRTQDFPDGIPKGSITPYLAGAVEIAEKASAHGKAKVALSLGPYGASMIPGQEYSGKYDAEHDSEEGLYQWHLERLRLFLAVERLQDRVRYVAFETLPRLDEVRAVRRAIRAAGVATDGAGPRFWISCVFPGETDDLPDGSTIDQVVEAMIGYMSDGARPWGIGINCTKIHKLPRLIRKFEDAVRKIQVAAPGQETPWLVLYPDGTNGEVYNTTTKQWEKPAGLSGEGQLKVRISSPDRPSCAVYSRSLQDPWEVQLAGTVQDAYSRGCFKAFLVGGCCKASHADIKRLHDTFHSQ
ncbi:Homocysteine S-methyltransferase [Macrophomina phaseolina MS6]|uniref:Homocysteine S-methyltransferase n=1 Tax=Macrophomina phaseolina (strain MS6) TaxID=1126212 RepID=K2QIP6_MACPH|nr:Homocysteine S-methyltransferase [Macrophomina phaseolina MS6]